MSLARNRTVKLYAAFVGLGIASAAAPATAQTALSGLAGNWSGGGQIRLQDGRSERISCRAFYTPRDGGSSMGLALRCASTSYKIEFRSSIQLNGSRVSGTWEERSFNAGGSVSGSASNGALDMAFSGTLSGSMSVSYGPSSQRVSINTGGGGVSSVSLSLSRG